MTFEAFKSTSCAVSSGANIFSFYRPSSAETNLPLIVLLHGYPQNHLMWKHFVELLPTSWPLFVPDLPGYGNSTKVNPTGSWLAFSKREMAKDILEAVDQVSDPSTKVIVCGHDRGGRVAYRMALDYPQRVVGLAVLDIVPTIYMWNAMKPQDDHKETKTSHHWIFLSSPSPLPETLIGNDARWYFAWTMSSWGSKAGNQEWISDSIRPLTDPNGNAARIAAICGDYRAGATVDVEHDREQGIDPTKEPQKVFNIPVLVLASQHLRSRHDVDGIWKIVVGEAQMESQQIGGADVGHFFVNECPDETAEKFVGWVGKHWVGLAPKTLVLRGPGNRLTWSWNRRWQSAAASSQHGRVLPSFSLAGKTCVVTGAARGLGYEFCRAFARSGCTKLGIIDLRQHDADVAAQELISELEADGTINKGSVDATGFECDVSNEQSVAQVFKDVVSRWGKVDCAVASAGIVENFTAFEYPTERMKKLYDINVHGVFFTAREAAKNMAASGGGSIILVASMSSHVVNIPQPQTPYNASKAAVKHMATSFAVEWAKDNVRVNSLSPGYMLTKLTKTILAKATDQTLKQKWESLTPMGKMGEPGDLAGPIVFLASDASGFMTGADLLIDGGYCAL